MLGKGLVVTLKTATCEPCGNEFAYDTLEAPYQRYCSPLCRNRAAQRKREAKASLPRRCPRCETVKESSEYASGTAPYCRPCMATYAREQRPNRGAEQRLHQSMQARAYKVGLTLSALEDLFTSQDGKCAICADDLGGISGPWHVDHDHACCPDTHGRKNKQRKRGCGRCIRGILCGKCNVGLGMLREDPVILKAAIAYLERLSTR